MKIRTFLILAVVFALSSCQKVGDSVDGISLVDINGDSIQLSNKITVVNVWATWCGTCISEIPELNRLHAKYRNDSDVQFIAISDEDLPTVQNALRRWPFNYRHVVDGSKSSDELQSRLVKTYPQNLVIDRKGKIIYEHSDASNDIYSSLDEAIQSLK